jgi:peptidoglycan/xylan/chitin deacetylase (PgdA/CDA1 family)
MNLWRSGILVIFAALLIPCGAAGAANVGAPPQTASQASTPVFTPANGTYTSPQSVTISTATPGAAIYYTTDGSDPTASSTLYKEPIHVSETTLLKAVATAKGSGDTSVAMAIYSIVRSGESDEKSSTLPAHPGTGVVPKPAGPPGGLKVLNWAGFKAAVTYTFDDSIPSQIANYPQLQATGVRMTFFLNGAKDGNSPVWAQAARDGHELGNHTEDHCHADGKGCGMGMYAGSLEAEYDECTVHILKTYGVNHVWTTASPYGDMGYDSIAPTRFFLNRGVRGGQIAPNDSSDPFNLPTYVAHAGDTASNVNTFIDSARAAGTWQILLFHSLGGDGGYAPVNPAEVIASINHAKSFGDVWVDSMVNVGAYWAGQKAISNANAKKSGRKTVLTWILPAHFPTGRFVRVTVTGGALSQGGNVLPWNPSGYYEVSLAAGSLTIAK